MFPRILVVLILLISLPAGATIKTWWHGFCERNLIAQNPYDGEESIQAARVTMGDEEFIGWLVNYYQRSGANIFWHRNQSRVIHRNFGIALRETRQTHPRKAIDDVLWQYEEFEKDPTP